MQVFLQLPCPLIYQAGQYLEIITADGQQTPFSIANASLGSRQLELHIRHTPENSVSHQIVSEIKKQGALNIVAPLGHCTYLSLKPHRPVIFMARGTGFAPIKAIIEQMLSEGTDLPMHLYWGAKNVGDQYLDELVQSWAEHVEHFQYTPILSSASSQWAGRSGNLIDSIAIDYQDFSNYQVFAAGPFDMMLRARDVFEKQGLKPENMYSDAFSD